MRSDFSLNNNQQHVVGVKLSKRLGVNIIRNTDCKDRTLDAVIQTGSSMVVAQGQHLNIGEKPAGILYT